MDQTTLSIVKPDAVGKHHTGAILARIEKSGLRLRAVRMLHMSLPQAQAFYAVHSARPFFASLTAFMASGPAVVSALSGPDAIGAYRRLMGATDPAKAEPGTLRRDFGASIDHNAVHGSDAVDTARFELGHFFAGLELI